MLVQISKKPGEHHQRFPAEAIIEAEFYNFIPPNSPTTPVKLWRGTGLHDGRQVKAYFHPFKYAKEYTGIGPLKQCPHNKHWFPQSVKFKYSDKFGAFVSRDAYDANEKLVKNKKK